MDLSRARLELKEALDHADQRYNPFFRILADAFDNPNRITETHAFLTAYLSTELYKDDFVNFSTKHRLLWYLNEILWIHDRFEKAAGDRKVLVQVLHAVDRLVIMMGKMDQFDAEIKSMVLLLEDRLAEIIQDNDMVRDFDIAFRRSPNIGQLEYPVYLDLTRALSFKEFYLQKTKPFIIRGFAKNWPLNEKLSSSLLRQKSERLVPVEVGSSYTSSDFGQKIVPFGAIIDSLMNKSPDKMYLAQYEIFNLFPDWKSLIETPEYCQNAGDVCINGWIGPQGTKSPMHQDPRDNLFVQVAGWKLWRIVSPKVDKSRLYLYGEEDVESNTSKIDMGAIDYGRFPLFKGIEYQECVLGPGDMLYVPSLWWHYVESLTSSFSVSFWFNSDLNKYTLD